MSKEGKRSALATFLFFHCWESNKDACIFSEFSVEEVDKAPSSPLRSCVSKSSWINRVQIRRLHGVWYVCVCKHFFCALPFACAVLLSGAVSVSVFTNYTCSYLTARINLQAVYYHFIHPVKTFKAHTQSWIIYYCILHIYFIQISNEKTLIFIFRL